MQLGLFDFDKSEGFSLNFESDWIKAIDENDGELFVYKRRLSTKKFPVKDGLAFSVMINTIIEGNEEGSWADEQVFKNEERAKETFESLKQ